ncbi:unnamed protein product [Diamesa hyperborea]
MVVIKIVISFVLLFVIINAGPIEKHNDTVNITKLTIEQFNETVEQTQNVWMIQIGVSSEPTKYFAEAAYILRGIVKAGIIEKCNGSFICEKDSAGKLPAGKIVFIHSKGVQNDFKNDQIIGAIVNNTMRFIQEKVDHQNRTYLQHYHNNVKIVAFKSEQN